MFSIFSKGNEACRKTFLQVKKKVSVLKQGKVHTVMCYFFSLLNVYIYSYMPCLVPAKIKDDLKEYTKSNKTA